MAATASRRDINALQEFSEYYLQTVQAEFNVIPEPSETSDPATKQAWSLAMQTRGKPVSDLDWSTLFAFENAVARLQPAERVRRRVYALREKYRGLVGQPAYDEYLKCAKPEIPSAEDPLLRVEMESLLGEFHWFYSATNARDALFRDMRGALNRGLAAGAILVLGYIVIARVADWPVSGLPVFAFVGALGAFVSILRRLQAAQERPVSPTQDPVATLTELGMGSTSVWVALVSGAIFPVLLLFLFAGGLVSGSLFPVMYTPELTQGVPQPTFWDFVLKTGPSAGGDYSKMIVWSFIAGFAERFVPDILDKLVAKGSEAAVVVAAPAPAPPALPATNTNGANGQPTSRTEGSPANDGGNARRLDKSPDSRDLQLT